MRTKLASIIIPVYNDEKYILEMLDSIKEQSYRPLELIIIDDNSSDKTLDLINSWKRNTDIDIYTKIFENEINKGLTKNINFGIENAEGEYILLADHDDKWNKYKVEKQINYLEKNEQFICCFCDRRLINETGSEICPSEYKLIGYDKFNANFENMINRKAKFSANVMCFRNNKNIINNIFPIPDAIIEHDYYITILLSYCKDIGYIHESLVDYRIHKTNLSANYWQLVSTNKDSFVKARRYSFNRYNKIKQIDKSIIESKIYELYNKKVVINYSLNKRQSLMNKIPDSIFYYIYLKILKRVKLR